MFPEPTELRLMGCSIESIWTPKIQIKHIDHKPTLTKSNEGKFRTWWMESSFVLVRHQPFQFRQQRQNDVEKNTRRCRWRKSQQQNRSRWWIWYRDAVWGNRTCLLRLHLKTRWTPNLKVRMYFWVLWTCSKRVRETLIGRLLIKFFKLEYWRNVVFSRVEIWWNVEHKYWKTRLWQISHRWWCGFWHRRRIEFFSKITFTLEQSEWSIAKDVGPFSKMCNARHDKCFQWFLGMFMFSTLEAPVFMWKKYSGNLHSIKHTGEHFILKQMFDISGKLIDGQIQMRSMEWLLWIGKILNGNNYFWSMMKKSPVSRMQRFRCSQILCYVLDRWIRTQHQTLFGKKSWGGSKVHQNTEFWTKLMVSQWNSSGISSQDSPHCSPSKKSKRSCQKWAINQEITLDGLIFMSMFNFYMWWI